MEKTYLTTPHREARSHARAVTVTGRHSRTIHICGQPNVDANGADRNFVTSSFGAAARAVLDRLSDTVQAAGATLDDIVTMTVFITDPRWGDEFVRIRGEYFKAGAYPASTLASVIRQHDARLMIEVAAVAVVPNLSGGDGTVNKRYVATALKTSRSHSMAVAVDEPGMRTVYIAGMPNRGLDGVLVTKSFDAAARASLDRLGDACEAAGATLDDIVTMTVYITDPRWGDEFVRIRSDYFKPGAYPTSALVTVAGLAQPDMLCEIQAVAVTKI